jgi:hypothetical protein
MAWTLRYTHPHNRYEHTKNFLRTMGLEDINSRGVFNNMDILHYRYLSFFLSLRPSRV